MSFDFFWGAITGSIVTLVVLWLFEATAKAKEDKKRKIRDEWK